MNANRLSRQYRVCVSVQGDFRMQQSEADDDTLCNTLNCPIDMDKESFLPLGCRDTRYWESKQSPRIMRCEAMNGSMDIRRSTVGRGSQNHGRPSSLSSVASSMSSRTSRCSDYFGGTCALDHDDSIQYYENSESLPVEGHSTLLDCVEETSGSGALQDHELDENLYDSLARKPEFRKDKKLSVHDINKRLSEVDHLSPISSMAMTDDPALTYVDRIMLELVETERMYVRALEDVLGGYLLAMKSTTDLHITPETIDDLFGNIKKIYAFNRKFLSSLENCVGAPNEIAKCFIKEEKNFQIYAEYCTNYPKSIGIMTRCMKINSFAEFLKAQQASLQHALPLGSYLLKPVQRILKYHLLIQDLLKNCKMNISDFDAIEQALVVMTKLAHHINEMKRKHEDTVYIQEIQSALGNWKGGELVTYGEIVKEGDLKLQGAKTGRYVYLFDKMLLVTKKRDDGIIMCKQHIPCSDIVLLESVSTNPLSFIVAPFHDHLSVHGQATKSWEKMQIQLTAQTLTDKLDWTYHIKKLILKHHHTAIPLKAQRTILRMNSFGGTATNSAKSDCVSVSEPEEKNIFSRIGSFGKMRRRSDSSSKKVILQQVAVKKQEDCSSMPSTPSLRSQSTTQFDYNTDITSQDQHNLASDNIRMSSKNVVLRKEVPSNHKVTTLLQELDGKIEKCVSTSSSGCNSTGYEDLDDLLKIKFDNNRQSVSWDIQIVDEVFKQYQNYPDGTIPKRSADQDNLNTSRKEITTKNSNPRKDFVKGVVERLAMSVENKDAVTSLDQVTKTISKHKECTEDVSMQTNLQFELRPLNNHIDITTDSFHQPGNITNIQTSDDIGGTCLQGHRNTNDALGVSHKPYPTSAKLPLSQPDALLPKGERQTKPLYRCKGRRVAQNNSKINCDTKRIPSGIVKAALSKYENFT